MKNTRLLLSSCALLFAYASTKAQTADNDELLRHIPADAATVYQVSLPSLMANSSWSNAINFISSTGKMKDQQIASVLADPTKLGVDTRRDLFISTTVNGIDSPRYTTIIIPIADSAKFLKFFKEQNKATGFTIRPGKVRTAYEEKGTSYAWNDRLLVVTFLKAPAEKAPEPAKKGAHPPVAAHPNWRMISIRKSIAALEGFPNTPFPTDSWFKQGLADGANFHMYSHGSMLGSLMKGFQSKQVPGMKEYLSAATKNTASQPQATMASLLFDNGRIVYTAHAKYNPTMAEALKLFGSRPLNEDLISRLPQGDLLGFATAHFNPQDLINSMNNANTRHVMDSALGQLQLSIEDITKAIKGDFLFAAIAPPKPANKPVGTDSTQAAKPEVDFYFVATLNDAAAFERIADKMKLFKQASESEDAGEHKKKPMFHTIKDNILVIANSQALTDGFFAGPGRGPSSLVNSDVRENPIAATVDFKTLAAFLADPGMATNMKAMQAAMLMTKLKSLTIAYGKMNGEDMQTRIEIKMTDESKNSLQSLLELVSPPQN